MKNHQDLYEMKYKFLLLLACLCMLTCPASAKEFQMVTEEYPPYNYLKDGRVEGVSADMVRAVLAEVGIQAPMNIYPWARAYEMARAQENVMIFSISRFPQRERLFQWVGVIAPINFYIFALKDRNDIRIDSLDDAKKFTIATVLRDALEQFLTSEGFQKMRKLSSNEHAMEMMMKKRVDLWPNSELAGYHMLRSKGYSKDMVRKVYHLDGFSKGDLYIAFGPKTSKIVVDSFRDALERVKKKGEYDKILSRFR